MAVTRIENATVLTMLPQQAALEDAVVIWEDNLLSYVGPRTQAPDFVIDDTIDGTNCVVMPGLINAHTHLAMTLFRGYADDMPLKPWLEEMIWPVEAKLEKEDVYWGTRLGALELLRGGITCFGDMYHYYPAATQAAWDSGLRACPAGVLLGFLSNPEDRLKEAADFIIQIRETRGGRIHPMLGPHAPYTCPDTLLQKVGVCAQALDVPVHIHISETAHEVEESIRQYGHSPVQHLDSLGIFEGQTLAAHCVWLDEQDIEILSRRQVGIAHCPGSNMKLASGFAPVPRLLEQGAVVALGTDGAASNNNLDLFEEAYLAAVLHKGHSGDPTVIKAREALEMMTRNAAKALGIGHLTGTLEAGKRADLAMIDLTGLHLKPLHQVESQLVYSARATDVKLTVVDGKIVMQDGDFPGQDTREIIRQATSRAYRLCQ